MAHGAPLAAVSQGGAIDVSGLVLGPPPVNAPTIASPAPGSVMTSKNITIGGQCIQNLVVKIFRQASFVGSSICDANHMWTMQIDLLPGRNVLSAAQFDASNQSSPVSPEYVVTYTPPSTSDPEPSPPSPQPPVDEPTPLPLYIQLQYDHTLQVIHAKRPFTLPLAFSGGVPPYAISVDWGDGKSSVASQSGTSLTGHHVYANGGYYTIQVRVADSKGSIAYMQFIVLVNGETTGKPSGGVMVVDTSTLPKISLTVGLMSLSFAVGLFLPRLFAWLMRIWMYLFRK